MGFNRVDVAELLVKCNRCCCICNRFCGIKIETDHIMPKLDSNDDNIDNAIPVCFDCHAEIHLYNDKHPRGRKYIPEELRMHKKKWLEHCEKNPGMRENKVESKQEVLLSLINELEFNRIIAENMDKLSIPFETAQFHKAMNSGILSFLDESIKNNIYLTYLKIKEANKNYDDYTRALEKHQGVYAITNPVKIAYENSSRICLGLIVKSLAIIQDISNKK